MQLGMKANFERLWIQKSVLLVFYSGMVKSLPWAKRSVRGLWILLGTTFIANIVMTFTGCHPFDHYWKVLPITGGFTEIFLYSGLTKFRQMYRSHHSAFRCWWGLPYDIKMQPLTRSGGTNMFTDVLLILLPIPVLVGVRLNWQKWEIPHLTLNLT